MMLGRLMLTAGVWACLVGAGRAGEEGPPPPEKQWFPPAFATRPRVYPPGPDSCTGGGCGHPIDDRPCWRRFLGWLIYRPLPSQCHGGYFCSSCGGGGCGCRQPDACCNPRLYTYFLARCPNCALPPLGAGPIQAPQFPEPGDPPFVDEGPHEVLPAR